MLKSLYILILAVTSQVHASHGKDRIQASQLGWNPSTTKRFSESAEKRHSPELKELQHFLLHSEDGTVTSQIVGEVGAGTSSLFLLGKPPKIKYILTEPASENVAHLNEKAQELKANSYDIVVQKALFSQARFPKRSNVYLFNVADVILTHNPKEFTRGLKNMEAQGVETLFLVQYYGHTIGMMRQYFDSHPDSILLPFMPTQDPQSGAASQRDFILVNEAELDSIRFEVLAQTQEENSKEPLKETITLRRFLANTLKIDCSSGEPSFETLKERNLGDYFDSLREPSQEKLELLYFLSHLTQQDREKKFRRPPMSFNKFYAHLISQAAEGSSYVIESERVLKFTKPKLSCQLFGFAAAFENTYLHPRENSLAVQIISLKLSSKK